VYVLAARINPANGCQRARVFRNQGYAHCKSHPSVLVLSRYPALLQLNPGPCGLGKAR
jgi:hypothetical protein